MDTIQTGLFVEEISPMASFQDLGREHTFAMGLSIGGALDRLALLEGAALLDHSMNACALELPLGGGKFKAQSDLWIALTGAQMNATVDGSPVNWNSSFQLLAGRSLHLNPPKRGNISYLHVRGGWDAPLLLGSASKHFAAHIGAPIEKGTLLKAFARAQNGAQAYEIQPFSRYTSVNVRLLPNIHTHLLSPEESKRFCATKFSRSPNTNRQGMELAFDGQPFALPSHLSLLSEPARPGDVQLVGQGQPFVLLCESQTMGGYPRVGSVHPEDLPNLVQLARNEHAKFTFLDPDEAARNFNTQATQLAKLKASRTPKR